MPTKASGEYKSKSVMVHWIQTDVTDNFFIMNLEFKRYEDANNINSVYFDKTPIYSPVT